MGVANEYVLLYALLSRLFYLHISKFSGPKTCTRAMAPKNINSIVEILFFFYKDNFYSIVLVGAPGPLKGVEIRSDTGYCVDYIII